MMHTTSTNSALIPCPKSMVGRVIGKGGETIKALQQYTGAVIQIDQSQDPTRVTIAGDLPSVELAAKMIKDIVDGNFKGFAMLRQLGNSRFDAMDGSTMPRQPVYVHGYGIIPPSQFAEPEDSGKSDFTIAALGPTTPGKNGKYEVQSQLAATATSPIKPGAPSLDMETLRLLAAQGSLAQYGLGPSYLPNPSYGAAQNGFGGNPNLLGGLDPAMAGLLGGYDAFSPGPHTPQQLPQQLPVTPSAEELLWHYQAQQLGQGHLATQLPLSGGPSPFAPLPASMPPQQASAGNSLGGSPVVRNLFGTSTPRAAQDNGSFRLATTSDWLTSLPNQREAAPTPRAPLPVAPSMRSLNSGGPLGTSPPSISTGARWWDTRASGSSTNLAPEAESPLAAVGSGAWSF